MDRLARARGRADALRADASWQDRGRGDLRRHRTRPAPRERLGVIPFNLQGLSHYLVAAVLGTEYAIGVRNGCFCAHPYVLHLLDIPEPVAWSWRKQVVAGCPGAPARTGAHQLRVLQYQRGGGLAGSGAAQDRRGRDRRRLRAGPGQRHVSRDARFSRIGAAISSCEAGSWRRRAGNWKLEIRAEDANSQRNPASSLETSGIGGAMGFLDNLRRRFGGQSGKGSGGGAAASAATIPTPTGSTRSAGAAASRCRARVNLMNDPSAVTRATAGSCARG